MKWAMYAILVCCFLGLVQVIDTFVPNGTWQIGGAFVCLFGMGIIGGVMIIRANYSRGQPVTIKQLRQRKAYYIIAKQVAIADGGDEDGFTTLVYIRESGTMARDGFAVKLPIVLPADATYFFVSPHYDKMGSRIWSSLTLLAGFSNGSEKPIIVPIKPEPKKSPSVRL